jgi:excisionase family DNA binding protein
MSDQKTEAVKRVKPKEKCRTMSIDQAAQILGLGRSTAYRYVESGEIPSIRIGNRVLITDTIIERLLAGA